MTARARINRRLASTTDLLIGAIGFLLFLVLLDSGGLAQWAERLEIGPLRTAAVPVTAAIDGYLRPFRFDQARLILLADLGRAGWSDNPAAVAITPPAPARIAIAVPVPPKPVAVPQPKKAPAAPPAPLPPIVAEVPSLTALPPLAAVPATRPRVVALVGDSMMAVGLSAVLLRETANHPELQMIRAFRSGTGLSRPDVFDWTSEYPAMIGTSHPDLAIVAMGANDAQAYLDAKGKIVSFGSAPWIANYRARVAAFMDMLEGSVRQVIWVGLPPMRSALYDAHMAEINRITYTVVSGYPNAAWWNPARYIGGKTGLFRNLGQVEGSHGRIRTAQLREQDGIHLSDDGAGLLTTVLIPWLEPPGKAAVK